MKTHRTLKSAVTIAVLGAFLAACSGGGDEANSAARPATTNNTTTPPKLPTIPPPVSSGGTNVGASGNEAIDNVAADTDKILEKLGMLENTLNETNDNANDAKNNSNWAKWLGIGIAGAMFLQMAANGFANGKETGSIWKGLGGFIFNTRSDADRKHAEDTADAKLKEYEATAGRYSARSDGRMGRILAAQGVMAKDVSDGMVALGGNMNTGLQNLGTTVTNQGNLTRSEIGGQVAANTTAVNNMNTILTGVKNQIATDLRVAREAETAAKTRATNLEAQLTTTSTSLDSAKAELEAARASNAQNVQVLNDRVATLEGNLGELRNQREQALEAANEQARLIQQMQGAQSRIDGEMAKVLAAVQTGDQQRIASTIRSSQLPDSTKVQLYQDLLHPQAAAPAPAASASNP